MLIFTSSNKGNSRTPDHKVGKQKTCKMKTLNLNKVDAASQKYFAKIKEENLLCGHDMIVFTDDYQFRLANKELVKLSESPKNIIRAYRIDSLGNLWVA